MRGDESHTGKGGAESTSPALATRNDRRSESAVLVLLFEEAGAARLYSLAGPPASVPTWER